MTFPYTHLLCGVGELAVLVLALPHASYAAYTLIWYRMILVCRRGGKGGRCMDTTIVPNYLLQRAWDFVIVMHGWIIGWVVMAFRSVCY